MEQLDRQRKAATDKAARVEFQSRRLADQCQQAQATLDEARRVAEAAAGIEAEAKDLHQSLQHEWTALQLASSLQRVISGYTTVYCKYTTPPV